MKDIYLITGASGFIGSQLTRRLINLNKTVHVISRNQKICWRLSDIQSKIHFHKIDILDKNLNHLIDKIRPTYIFHLAAYGSLPKEDNAEKMFRTNILGTMNLIRSLSPKYLKLFINAGSSAEYKINNEALREDDCLEPLNDYGLSKMTQTLYCQKEAKKNNLPIITFRLFSPYGPFEKKTRLIPEVILHAITNRNVPLSEPKFVRDFIFVDDVVDAYLQACKKLPKPGEIFNIGSGKQSSIENVVKIVLLKTNSKSKPLWGAKPKHERQMEPKIWKANITKAKQHLEWKPAHTLADGISRTITWFNNNKFLYAR
jgi:nucleoside-diphosphate-sugar epimerase